MKEGESKRDLVKNISNISQSEANNRNLNVLHHIQSIYFYYFNTSLSSVSENPFRDLESVTHISSVGDSMRKNICRSECLRAEIVIYINEYDGFSDWWRFHLNSDKVKIVF